MTRLLIWLAVTTLFIGVNLLIVHIIESRQRRRAEAYLKAMEVRDDGYGPE